MNGLPLDVWVAMIFAILAFWGVATWALVRTLRQEDRKLEILEEQEDLDTHSPRALRELREWIRANPDDPDVDAARETYNRCVETLRRTDRHFYDWSREEIRGLEPL